MINLFVNRCCMTSYIVTCAGKLPRNGKMVILIQISVYAHTGHIPIDCTVNTSMLFGWVQCAGFRMELSLFQTDEAYTQVCHTGCLVLSSFPRPSRVGVRQGGYQHKITTPASDSTRRRRGWGERVSGPAYITVAVGNHIHQIKSSIYLCGSGDSGGGAGGLR